MESCGPVLLQDGLGELEAGQTRGGKDFDKTSSPNGQDLIFTPGGKDLARVLKRAGHSGPRKSATAGQRGVGGGGETGEGGDFRTQMGHRSRKREARKGGWLSSSLDLNRTGQLVNKLLNCPNRRVETPKLSETPKFNAKLLIRSKPTNGKPIATRPRQRSRTTRVGT
jgi:hypothetical protein